MPERWCLNCGAPHEPGAPCAYERATPAAQPMRAPAGDRAPGTPMERWRAHEAIHANILERIEKLEENLVTDSECATRRRIDREREDVGDLRTRVRLLVKRIEDLEDNAHCPDIEKKAATETPFDWWPEKETWGPCPECGAKWEPIPPVGSARGLEHLKRQHDPNCALLAAKEKP